MKIPLIKPFITDELKARVLSVLDSGFLTEGKVTHEFEDAIRKHIGCKHAIAVTSCTTGLEMALRVLGIGSGDEVIVPDFTYPATASVVNMVGATVVLVDVDPNTLNIAYDSLEKAITKKTKALLPVSLFGNPLDWDRLNEIKKKHKLFIIEDAACSLGSEFKHVKTGCHADISVFSFHPRKFITTGEGGMITTENDTWAEWMDSYKHFGMESCLVSRSDAQFVRVGGNYKMSDVLAAIGVSQMKHIDPLLERREALSQNYDALLSRIPEVRLPRVTDHGRHSRQTYCIQIERRDAVRIAMRDLGFEVQIATYALHLQKAFSDNPLCRKMLPLTHSAVLFQQSLCLPLYHDLSFSDQEALVKALERCLRSLHKGS